MTTTSANAVGAPWPSVSYRERGQGAPLLLVNGMAVSGDTWPDSLLQRLERSFRVITMDNRGTRAPSSPPAGPFSLHDLALDAVEVLDRCGVGAADVLAHSMGGLIALTLAATCPTRVRRLVVTGTSAGGHLAVPPAPEVRARLSTLPRDGSRPEQMCRLAAAPGFCERHPDIVAALVDKHRNDGINPSVVALQVAAAAGFDASCLADVAASTLVIHGELDPLVPPENGRRLSVAIPDARLVELPGVGHLIAHEATDRCAQLVEQFLSPSSDAAAIIAPMLPPAHA